MYNFEWFITLHTPSKHHFKPISKIDGCSLKKIGEVPFDVSMGIRCIGVPSLTNSSDQILFVNTDDLKDGMEAFTYVTETLGVLHITGLKSSNVEV